jgi:hypothetical protein
MKPFHQWTWLLLIACAITACPQNTSKSVEPLVVVTPIKPAPVKPTPEPIVNPQEDPRADPKPPAGTKLPDLVALAEIIKQSWSIRKDTFSSSSCTSIEGGFPGGTYYTLNLTVTTANLGSADLLFGKPEDKVDPNGDGNPIDGLTYLSSCHKHYHVKHYSTYEFSGSGTVLKTPLIALKQGHCLIDTIPVVPNPAKQKFPDCKFQGLTAGWGDVYDKNLDGQFFLLGPADAKSAGHPIPKLLPELLPAGEYEIRIVVNPGFEQTPGGPCPHKDGLGLCRLFEESKYSNNVTKVKVQVPDFSKINFPANQEWTWTGFQCDYGTDDTPPDGFPPNLPDWLSPDDPLLNGKGCPPPDPSARPLSVNGWTSSEAWGR